MQARHRLAVVMQARTNIRIENPSGRSRRSQRRWENARQIAFARIFGHTAVFAVAADIDSTPAPTAVAIQKRNRKSILVRELVIHIAVGCDYDGKGADSEKNLVRSATRREARIKKSVFVCGFGLDHIAVADANIMQALHRQAIAANNRRGDERERWRRLGWLRRIAATTATATAASRKRARGAHKSDRDSGLAETKPSEKTRHRRHFTLRRRMRRIIRKPKANSSAYRGSGAVGKIHHHIQRIEIFHILRKQQFFADIGESNLTRFLVKSDLAGISIRQRNPRGGGDRRCRKETSRSNRIQPK